MLEYVAVLLPSIGVGAIFYFVMRSIFNADRAEREAMSQAEERQAQAQQEAPVATPDHEDPAESR
ncbi:MULTISPECIES: hypothetical protein [unclassified Arthrobacter]|uniref:hypothetical protein n=1 Tax=unclassified Arthrobacter TaxID=235627 RepID=UPI0003161EED|nr:MULTISPECIES: hypothetical protein [unclassified Arthrobacter]PVE16876.1 hypothetical protein DDA93_11560 [Arthrobacter sp. Bz4]